MVLAQVVTARDVVETTNWFQEHTGVGWTVAAVLLVLLGGGWTWFYFRKYRPLVAAVGTVVRGPAIRGPVIIGTAASADGITMTINGSALRDFKNEWRAALVTGPIDPSIDKFVDDRMAISEPFTIVGSPFDVRVPYSAAMVGMRDEAVRQMRLDFKENNPQVKPGALLIVSVEVSSWQHVILLPFGVRSNEIKTLGDVKRLGGKVLTQELDDGRLNVILDVPPVRP